MEVKLRVVGCSPAWPNPGGAQSGYLVESDGARVLLDCGPGVLARLREWEDWPRVDAIAITHWHLDHWGDLIPWVWGAMFGPARELDTPEL
jgi:ribonuclease BN (tRNA processing enzyme)